MNGGIAQAPSDKAPPATKRSRRGGVGVAAAAGPGRVARAEAPHLRVPAMSISSSLDGPLEPIS